MAGNVKGITIEFRGDTTKLDKALRQVNNETKSIDRELKQVNKALKFNPTSVELWRQKQNLLNQKITETKDKLSLLKQQQQAMDAKGVDKNSAEYQKLKREIVTTESKLKTFKGQLKEIGNVKLKAASEQFKQWGSSLENAGRQMQGISMAAGALVASLGALSYSAGQNADDLNTMSKVYGIGTDDLQRYKAAADLVDVDIDTIAKSHQKLTRSMSSAQDGTGAQAEAFEKLGVSITDANGNMRDSDAVWQDTIKALGGVENETERDALAMQLMGKSASELNPLIEDGGKTYENVAKTMEKYGLDFIDQETLDKANEFNDQLDTMKLIGSVAIAQVGSQLAAYLAPALEKVVGWIGKLANWLSKLSPEVLTIIGIVAGVVAAIAPVLIILGKLSFAISSIMTLTNTLGIGIGAIAGPIGIVIAVIAAVIAAFVLWRKHGDKIKKFFKDFGEKIADVWDGIKEAVTTAVEGVKEVVSKVFNAIKTIILTIVKGYVTMVRTQFNLMKIIITTVVNAIKVVITTVFNAIKTFLTTVVQGWQTILTTAWNSIRATASSAWNAIKNAIVAPINAARSTVTSIVNSIRSAVTGAFSGLASSVRGAFNSVKTAITQPIQNAFNAVKSAVSKIKGLFPLHIGKVFSGLKLPHFEITSRGKFPWGIAGKGSVPKWSVSWYKTGGIFNSPSLIGVGEAGSEAVVPLDKFWKTLEGMNTGETNIVINVNGAGDPRAVAEEVKRMLIRETNQRRLAWQ